MMMATLLHLTTVHRRSDTRILIKEAQTLASSLPHKVLLMVADGKGDVDEEDGRVSIHDLGRLDGGRLHRALVGPWRALLAIRSIKPDIVHFHDPELITVRTPRPELAAHLVDRSECLQRVDVNGRIWALSS